jgi:hypothetical protein
MFLRFVDDLYRQSFARYEQDLRILANGVGLGPTDALEVQSPLRRRETSAYPENNIQMCYEVETFQFAAKTPEITRDFSTRLRNNYGLHFFEK